MHGWVAPVLADPSETTVMLSKRGSMIGFCSQSGSSKGSENDSDGTLSTSTSTIQIPPLQLHTSVDSARLVFPPPLPRPRPAYYCDHAKLLGSQCYECHFAVPPSKANAPKARLHRAPRPEGSKIKGAQQQVSSRSAENTCAIGASSSAAASPQKAGKGIGQLKTLWDTSSSEGGSPRIDNALAPLARNVRKTILAQVNKAYERQA